MVWIVYIYFKFNITFIQWSKHYISKITWTIKNHHTIKETHFNSIARPFDWETMAPMYDNATEKV